jgi:DNA repair protein RadC
MMKMSNRDVLLELFRPVQRGILIDLLPENVTFRDLMTINTGDIMRRRGAGINTVVRIVSICELFTRWNSTMVDPGKPIEKPEDLAIQYGHMKHLEHEEFHVLLLDNAGHIMKDHMVSKGIVNASLVHPREVFREAIRQNASSVILLHNHPSGVKEASREDHLVTKQLVETGRIIDIPVHDHIIICGDSYVSFAENGWLEGEK